MALILRTVCSSDAVEHAFCFCFCDGGGGGGGGGDDENGESRRAHGHVAELVKTRPEDAAAYGNMVPRALQRLCCSECVEGFRKGEDALRFGEVLLLLVCCFGPLCTASLGVGTSFGAVGVPSNREHVPKRTPNSSCIHIRRK
ncbi:hypothetical protein Vafri_5758 [Volvox africanus]|nr:hypothetical protein Vafri_5758 [Volvox africanus]